MKTNLLNTIILIVVTILVPNMVTAQAAKKPSKPSIGIQAVQINDAIKTATKEAGSNQYLTLERITQSMDQQLIDRMHNTRKFQIVSRSDLKTILDEQDLQSVISNPSDVNTAQAFKVAGCKYSLIVSVDDYQDLSEHLRGEGGQVLATKRTIRLSAISKLYDNTTGVLLESANFQISNKDGAQKMAGAIGDGRISDRLITELARRMSDKSANRVMDVLFPAKVIGLTGNFVTINRGDGTGITKDQVWTIYATGESMIDPDTGEELGAEEIPVGKIKVTQVTPKFSRGMLIENYGVEKLHVARSDESNQ
ncbi:Curli production assembly/transport component CsgG [Poriferisphaera corsica]|uniref:Curli production assembly/transport component CsgG n=1 Tax=Poriferisphaera corsica TaxID=2528020 RepID=A0A517YTI8_9BACT|nr:CsgG/HfaB family protein [Poriferisphaera corsica]QDU33545.1 Curli production assembly/transport component CsgG [Poriferisphaera corsica]